MTRQKDGPSNFISRHKDDRFTLLCARLSRRHRKSSTWPRSTFSCLPDRLRPGTIFSKSWASTVCRPWRCSHASRIISASNCPITKSRGSVTLRLWLSEFSPACNAGPLQIPVCRRSSQGRAGSVRKRSVSDRGGPRTREGTPHLSRFQGTRSSAGQSIAERKFHGGGPRQHYHDQSVEVADLRLCRFLCRWRPRSTRLQTYTRRTLATPQALRRQRSHCGISDWRHLSVSAGRTAATNVQAVLVTEAPANAVLARAQRWEEFRGVGEPIFVPRSRRDTACIVYSSGTGGRPKGCMITHENYLEQCVAL